MSSNESIENNFVIETWMCLLRFILHCSLEVKFACEKDKGVKETAMFEQCTVFSQGH